MHLNVTGTKTSVELYKWSSCLLIVTELCSNIKAYKGMKQWDMVRKRYTMRYGYEEIHNKIWLWRDTQ